MKKKSLIAIIGASLAVVIIAGIVLGVVLSGGGNNSKKDSIVIMTEELSRLFNPFYATAGTDMDVVGMTQIGMLSTDRQGNPEAGDDLPTVVKAFKSEFHPDEGEDGETVYTFVLKNGIKYSDGVPLTMNDVMFNIYEYLDPVYTGSSTMYSTKIKGLTEYRTQQLGDDSYESTIAESAAAMATERVFELMTVYEDAAIEKGGSASHPMYDISVTEMKEAIDKHSITSGYMSAVATDAQQATWTEDDYRAQLKADYDFALTTFMEELHSDFRAAKESFDTTTPPYNAYAKELENDFFKFFLYEGYIKPVYNKVPSTNKDDKLSIQKFENTEIATKYTTEDAAVERVYNDTVTAQLSAVLSYWGTAGTLRTNFTASAKGIILKNQMTGDQLEFPNIEGIVSLGHTGSVDTVSISGQTYTVAKTHNEDGTVKNAGEYDVLQVTVEGTDPKAIYSFGFSVAPVHYYTADETHPNGREVDIANNKFGVEYANAEFQSKVIQSQQHVKVPLGAGTYMATDSNNSDTPSESGFFNNNIVYYKANPYFTTLGEQFEVKTKKLQYQVVSPSNAIDKLENGEVDFITPQFTKANSQRLAGLGKKGIKTLDTWQLGYGYIGINAGKVPNINVRKAIMCAMQIDLALTYYEAGQCENISWPMSKVSWAYPYEPSGAAKINGKDYMMWTNRAAAESKIQDYMRQAEAEGVDSSAYKIRFTIAGSSITEHPTYTVFKQAAEILNDLGWNVEVKADSQALTKLSTGSLEVWAAAWGSSIDPDMYQVYHKNSTATSVYAWGYREILADTTTYARENSIISELSVKIEEAREIDQNVSEENKQQRIALYEEAMGLVLDLAVEMPVYQRKNLYAYNEKRIVAGINENVNPYSSPLEEIWKVELAD